MNDPTIPIECAICGDYSAAGIEVHEVCLSMLSRVATPPALDRDALARAIHATGHCDVSSYQLSDRPGFGIRHDHDDMAAAILAALAASEPPTDPERLDVERLEAMRAFSHAVGMALTERKVPAEWDADDLAPPQMLEATAHLLDRLDDATDAYIAARKTNIPAVSRSMQVDLRALAAHFTDTAQETTE